jgi:adenine/guanine phosphoribosyltransferase-like PRPP-binding protein
MITQKSLYGINKLYIINNKLNQGNYVVFVNDTGNTGK